MKNQVKKIIILAAFGLVVMALSACSTNTNNLLGAAGQPTETPTLQPIPEASPEPTLPPIPETYGHIIFVSDRDGDENLYITSPDGLEQTRLTEIASENPRISPDGTRVAFASNTNDNMDVYVLEIATRNLIRVTDAPARDAAPSWSPDGTRLVFESFRDGNLEIYMVNADGTNPTRLTNDPSGDSSPIWSPVANEIAFVSNRFGNADIFLLTPNGGVSTLTTSIAPDSAPAWSPNGNTIAFQTFSGELSNICTINRDATNPQCVTNSPSDYGAPVWSPDGIFIAADAKQSAGYGITVFNTLDKTILELSAQGIDPRGDPVWSPEGARVVFQAQADGNMDLFTALVSTREFTRLTAINGYDGEPAWSGLLTDVTQ